MRVLGALVAILAVCILPIVRYSQELRYLSKMLPKAYSIGEAKKVFNPLVSLRETWPQPSVAFNSTRILWGYWDSGNNTMPGFADLAMSLSMKRLPGWQLIILDRINYKSFVGPSDLPSTFKSLRGSAQKEILMAAVLWRYGGAFMDVSSVLIKGLDELWDRAPLGKVFLVHGMTASNRVQMVDTRLILAPSPGSMLLNQFQHEMIEYYEAPASNVEQMKAHPKFQKSAACFTDKGLGVGAIENIGPYLSGVYLLSTLVHYQFLEEVILLPPARWIFDLGIPIVVAMPGVAGDLDDTSEDTDSSDVDLSLTGVMGHIWRFVTLRFGDDLEAAQKVFRMAHLFKVSSDLSIDLDEPAEYHLEQKSTMGRIYRMLNDSNIATQQVSLKGMKQPRTVANKSRGLCD